MQTEIDDESLESAIPPWAEGGILPPFRVSPAHRAGGSPYPCTSDALVRRFLQSPEVDFGGIEQRKSLLSGLLAYRSALRSFGLEGFQWVFGSFLEDVERSPRSRPPVDVDVIGFVQLPQSGDKRSSVIDLFQDQVFRGLLGKESQKTYGVESFVIFQNLYRSDYYIEQCRYWLSLASHQRDTLKWKGLVRLELTSDPTEDALAARTIEEGG